MNKQWRMRALGACLGGIAISMAACSQSASPSPTQREGLGQTEQAEQVRAPVVAAPVVPGQAGLPPSNFAISHKGLPPGAWLTNSMRAKIGSNSCFAGTPSLLYHGGEVIQNVEIVSVLWTSNVDPNVVGANMGKFYTDITHSTLFDWLNEYNTIGQLGQPMMVTTNQGINRGTYKGQFTITPTTTTCTGATPCTIDDTNIKAELAAQIQAGSLPQPTLGCDGTHYNTIYMFDFPANVTITFTIGGQMATSCQQFCAYHYNTQFNGKNLPYGVLPDLESGACSSVCSTTPPAGFPDVTAVRSHELIEAVTDSAVTIDTTGYIYPSAWGDPNCGEIGDICNFQEQQTSLNGDMWTIQQEWSNAANDCIVNRTPSPACTAPNTPPGCRACACSDSNEPAGCGAGTNCSIQNPPTNNFCMACMPLTMCPAPDNCGTISDGCGGMLNCGTCTSPQTCGGGGTPNVCGCTPLTMCPAPDNCGMISDGCGGKISCGTSTSPNTCGGGGTPNVCGCTPLTMCPSGDDCGTLSDGCGGTIACGTADGGGCTAPQTCGGGGMPNHCGCTPMTQCPSGDDCGTVPNGCGGMITCGTCSGGATCTANHCVGGMTDGGTEGGPGLDSGTGSDSGSVRDSGANRDSGSSGGDSGTSGSDGSAGSDGGGGGGGGSSGCSCRTAGSSPSPSRTASFGFGALIVLGAVRMRRRRARRA